MKYKLPEVVFSEIIKDDSIYIVNDLHKHNIDEIKIEVVKKDEQTHEVRVIMSTSRKV